jgi:hypothetical protein
MAKEWVTENFCIGFCTDKGLMLDLDNMTLTKARRIAEALMKRYRLEGYLLIESSERNYHVVFNRYLRWKTILKIVFSQVVCIRWGIHQARKGYLTLRISRKNNRNKPKILMEVGKTDKLINEYLLVYNHYRRF